MWSRGNIERHMDSMGGGGIPWFIAAWMVMMVAMMLPSAAPLMLLYRRGASTVNVGILTVGYFTVWTLAGLPAYWVAMKLPKAVAPVALAVAGVYQLTPLK